MVQARRWTAPLSSMRRPLLRGGRQLHVDAVSPKWSSIRQRRPVGDAGERIRSAPDAGGAADCADTRRRERKTPHRSGNRRPSAWPRRCIKTAAVPCHLIRVQRRSLVEAEWRESAVELWNTNRMDPQVPGPRPSSYLEPIAHQQNSWCGLRCTRFTCQQQQHPPGEEAAAAAEEQAASPSRRCQRPRHPHLPPLRSLLLCEITRAAPPSTAMPDADAASSSTSSSSPLPSSSPAPGEAPRKSCRVCSDEEDLFASMRHKMYASALRKEKGSGGEEGGAADAAPVRDKDRHREKKHRSAEVGSVLARGPSPSSSSSVPLPSASSSVSAAASAAAAASVTVANISDSSPSEAPLAAGRALPCPPDATRLGRAAWSFLHSVAAYFPARASPLQSEQALALLHSLPHLYPCPHCAQHLSLYYQQHRPEEHVQGRDQLGLYLCAVHNDVRQRQGKRTFDCARWRERWGGQDWEEEFGEERTHCDPKEYGDVEEEGKGE